MCQSYVLTTFCSVVVVLFLNIQDDYNAHDTKNAEVNTYIVNTIESEVTDEGSGLYEVEEQDNYLKGVEEHNDERLGEEHFETESSGNQL